MSRMSGKFSNWSIAVGLGTIIGTLIGAYIVSVLGYSPEFNVWLVAGIVIGGVVVGCLARIIIKGPSPIIKDPK